MKIRVLFFLLLASPSLAAGKPTAVFTLDVRHEELRSSEGRALREQFRRYAAGCRIVPGGAIFELSCAPPARPRRRENQEETGKPVTLALFRDLDETVYLAGCPLLEKEPDDERSPTNEEETEPRELETELERICEDVDRGHTFSAEVERNEMRIVARGRSLPMRVFRVQEKERHISTAYELTPSTAGLGPAGPATTHDHPPPLGGPEPKFEPVEVQPTVREPNTPRRSIRDPGTAKTSLRVGRIEIVCSSGHKRIKLDGAYRGELPLRMPLEAGRHVLEHAGGREEVFVKNGEDLKIDVCR